MTESRRGQLVRRRGAQQRKQRGSPVPRNKDTRLRLVALAVALAGLDPHLGHWTLFVLVAALGLPLGAVARATARRP